MEIVVLDNFTQDFYRWSSDALIKVLIVIAGFYGSDRIHFVTNRSYYELVKRDHDTWTEQKNKYSDGDDVQEWATHGQLTKEKKLVIGSSVEDAQEWVFQSVQRFNERICLVDVGDVPYEHYLSALWNPETTLVVSAKEVDGFTRLFDDTFDVDTYTLNDYFLSFLKDAVPAPFSYAKEDVVLFLDFDGVLLGFQNKDDDRVPQDYEFLPGIQHCDVAAFKTKVSQKALNNLRKLVEKYNAKIVLSTMWFDMGKAALEKLFQEEGWSSFSIAGKILHQHSRATAIQEYCDYYGINHFMILDDLEVKGFGKRFIYCNRLFSDECYAKADAVLAEDGALFSPSPAIESLEEMAMKQHHPEQRHVYADGVHEEHQCKLCPFFYVD